METRGRDLEGAGCGGELRRREGRSCDLCDEGPFCEVCWQEDGHAEHSEKALDLPGGY